MNTTVTSQANPLAYMKAIATLVGTIATALLGVYTADTEVGKVLTILAIIATAVATWALPNADVVTSDVPVVEEVDEEDDESYEGLGGQAYPDEPLWGSEGESGSPDRH